MHDPTLNPLIESVSELARLLQTDETNIGSTDARDAFVKSVNKNRSLNPDQI